MAVGGGTIKIDIEQAPAIIAELDNAITKVKEFMAEATWTTSLIHLARIHIVNMQSTASPRQRCAMEGPVVPTSRY